MKCAQKLLWIVVPLVLCHSVCLASVVVSPSSAQISPGAQLQFSATGSSNNVVLWSISGNGCSGTSCGVITNDGLYTAPRAVPNPALVLVTATSLADLTQSGRATVTIGSQPVVSITLSPLKATIAQLGQQQFSAIVAGSSNAAVSWTLSGAGCAGSSCGVISSGGRYSAPATVPSPASVTITARSAAYPTKSASATVTIEAATVVSASVAPSTAQISVGGTQQFTATVTGSTNTSVNWTIAGAGCSGPTCGSISASGLYTAPASVPSVPKVIVIATPVAAPSRTATATATIVPNSSSLTVSPNSSQLKPGAQVQFLATGPGSGVVIWSISGSGCSGTGCGVITSSGFYTAPMTVPNPAAVTVFATSLANPALVGSAIVSFTTSSQVGITVSPNSAQLGVGAQQQFTATVTGTSNQAVVWSVNGYSCAGSACGTITSGGRYTAPSVLPNPAIIFVTATSQADPTKSNTATVTMVTAIAVSISPTSAQVDVNGYQQFTAKVTGTAIGGVTWSVSGSGCSGIACGSVSSTGLYRAPANAPSPATIRVTATSIADSQASASATVTIIVPITVTISPTDAILTVGDRLQFGSTVSGTANRAVSWSISGPGCSGSACGAISSNGLYTAPATVPSQTTVIVKATSQAETSVSASAVVTLLTTNNAKLSGQYAFLFSGFNSDGVYQEVGSIEADGKGKIVSGLEDVNDFTNPATKMSVSGSYQMGSDNRGVMTIKSPLGTQTLRFALNLTGTRGRLISFDQSGVRGSGEIFLQDPTAFDPAVLAGGYVLNLTGMNLNGSRVGALGIIFPDGNGFISGSSMDVNEGGVVSPTFATFSGVYGLDPTGRGTITLSIPGFDGGSFTFAFYVVSANKLLLLSVDPLSFANPIFSGPAELQSGAPFTSASFSGGSVFELSGSNGTSGDDTVGRFQFGAGGNILMNFDQNNGGSVTIGGVMTGAYDVQLNGRGTLNLINPADGSTQVWYLYALAPNRAFIMDASGGSVGIGEVTPQIDSPPFSNSDVLGTYVFGSGEPIVGSSSLYTGTANFDGGSSISGSGALTGPEDVSKATALSANQGFNGIYSVSGVSNNGRGTILLAPTGSGTIAVWVASPSTFVGLWIDGTSVKPTILHFDQ